MNGKTKPTRRNDPAAEKLLLQQVRAGNREAFSELVRLHSPRVYGISFKILKNREDAEDNVQNVLCKAFRKIHLFQGNSSISTWLFRIATNEALMKLRKQRSERVIGYSEVAGTEENEGGVLEMADSRSSPESQCIVKDLASKAFRGLDPVLRHVFILYNTGGWTNRELSKALGTSTETTKSRVFRTRVKLRRKILALSPTLIKQRHEPEACVSF